MSEPSPRRCSAPEEEELERSLRPRRLDEFVGQERVKEQLAIALDAPRKARGEALDHVLLVGPPGLGKTRLALHHPRGARRRHPHGRRAGARAEGRPRGDPHRARGCATSSSSTRSTALNRAVEEILYPALEDFRLDIIVGQGPAARTLTLDLPPFTLVGATTRTGLLTTPLRDRFGMTFRLGYYEPDELAAIVRRSARILGVDDRGRRRRRDRAPLARDAADREPDPAARPRRRRGAPPGRDHDRDRARGARAARGRRARGSSGTDRELLRAIASSSTAARSASRRSPSRSARSPTRSRTSTSRTCSSSASSSAPRAAG